MRRFLLGGQEQCEGVDGDQSEASSCQVNAEVWAFLLDGKRLGGFLLQNVGHEKKSCQMLSAFWKLRIPVFGCRMVGFTGSCFFLGTLQLWLCPWKCSSSYKWLYRTIAIVVLSYIPICSGFNMF
jgi:hypothetical protein